MRWMALRATVTALASVEDSMGTNAPTAPRSTMKLIWAMLACAAAFAITHAASLRISNLSLASVSTTGWNALCSTSAWIWEGGPAAMLDSAQHASLRSDTLSEPSTASSAGMQPALMAVCVCLSSPVTMLPNTRSAGVRHDAKRGLVSSSTTRLTQPDSSTDCTWSLEPSLRKEMHHSASRTLIASSVNSTRVMVGSIMDTLSNGGAGLPRHRLLSAHSVDCTSDSRVFSLSSTMRSSGATAP
mmetsp:Transcript_6207/g.19765  ORF Transcript_6207/g.19765 Transcript_6207/m.19765 type:complete len:243 (-) Transcript_6207:600-1328(-)